MGFSVARKGNVWCLRMQGISTEGKFGTLKAAMKCAYILAHDSLGQTDIDEPAA